MVNMKRTFDYAPLSTSVSARDMFLSLWRQTVETSKSSYTLMRIAVGVLVFASLILVWLSMSGHISTLLLVGGMALAVLMGALAQRDQIRLRRFAQANNLAYIESTEVLAREGTIFNRGHSQRIVGGIRSEEPGFYEIANYRYTTGSGKNQQLHKYGFVSIKLPRKLPHMLLDSRKNNFMTAMTNLPELVKSGQALRLEGDFNEHFTLYVPAGYERDALYVLTPDIMQLLIDRAAGYDVEIVDDRLYLYVSGAFALTDATKLQQLFQLADTLYNDFYQQTDHYADARIGDRAANLVHADGARLRHQSSLGLVMLIVGVVAVVWVLISVSYYVWNFW